ncbi:MAG: hypothetical protein QOJ02_3120 [Acidobacteriota bacterium]|nr:hypothetical protein [Acidobacteriota bacterium]
MKENDERGMMNDELKKDPCFSVHHSAFIVPRFLSSCLSLFESADFHNPSGRDVNLLAGIELFERAEDFQRVTNVAEGCGDLHALD